MKISIDGGALHPKNQERFGTAIFSENLIKALHIYDKNNRYYIYTFDNLKPRLFWLKGRVSLEEFKEKKDVFLALNQAVPLYVSGKVISFCHGLSYYFYPQYYSKKDLVRLNGQLKEMVNKSDFIIVSSEKIKKELEAIPPYLPTEKKIVVMPFGIPFDMYNKKIKDQRSRLRQDYGGQAKIKKKRKYFLFVGNNQLIKNIQFIKKVFESFKSSKDFKDIRLVLVTNKCSRKKLRSLYRGATALLTASFYESFNLPVLEALSQGCPVIGLNSAVIPELNPFVFVAGNSEQFVSLMEQAARNKLAADKLKLIRKKFSWKSYVNNLVKLY
jgi:glycosyltransferase involved in cell wall biosynthesis